MQDLPLVPATAVFGATGFIGRNILAGLRRANPSCIGVSRKTGAGMLYLDLAKPDIGPLGLKKQGVTHAIIAAGVSNVAACEREPALSYAVNVDGTVELARQLMCEGIRIVAFSSDYVFDGSAGNYDEGAPVNPINEYGRQKAEMESRLHDICDGEILVIRLSKVFDLVRGSGTLLDEMTGKLLQGISVRAAVDQYFCPTFIDDVVNVVRRLLVSEAKGIVHLCAPTKTSRLNIAMKLASSLQCSMDLVREISLRDLGETFPRPLDTSMITNRLFGFCNYRFKPLESCIEDLKAGMRSGTNEQY